MLWIGIIIGLFLGVNFGIFLLTMLTAANEGDRQAKSFKSGRFVSR